MANQSHIKIRVIPRSSRNQIVRKEGDVVTLKLTSPPVGGAANKSLIAFLADQLRLPKEHIEIISGKTSRLKLIRVQGLPPNEINDLLGL
jgi:hypothetical protein